LVFVCGKQAQVVNPLADQGGLAKASRGGNESHFPVQTGIQLLQQTRTGDEF